MHSADVMWVLLKLVLLPVLLAACFLISMLGRQAARLWLPVVFALQSMVLSSQTACLLFTLTYAVNSGWIPWSDQIRQAATWLAIKFYLFGHGGYIRLLILIGTFVYFAPWRTALFSLFRDVFDASRWVSVEAFTTSGEPFDPLLTGLARVTVIIVAYRQFTNALWDTEAWHTIITGSVLTPRMMHVFAHVQVLLTLSALSWIRAGFRETREDADEKEREPKQGDGWGHEADEPENDYHQQSRSHFQQTPEDRSKEQGKKKARNKKKGRGSQAH